LVLSVVLVLFILVQMIKWRCQIIDKLIETTEDSTKNTYNGNEIISTDNSKNTVIILINGLITKVVTTKKSDQFKITVLYLR
jgi:hypothetical protein